MRPIVDRTVIFPAAVLLVLAIAVVAHAQTPSVRHTELNGDPKAGATGYIPGFQAYIGMSQKF